MCYEKLLNKSLGLLVCFIILSSLCSSFVLANPVRFTSSNLGEIAENDASIILVVEAVADQAPTDTVVAIALVSGDDAALFSLVNVGAIRQA